MQNRSVILRYEAEARAAVDTVERACEVRSLRVEHQGSWRYVAEEARPRWNLDAGLGDDQSLATTLCHVAAEVLDEDPDAAPWS